MSPFINNDFQWGRNEVVVIYPDKFQRGIRDHRGQPEQWVMQYQGSLLAWREWISSHGMLCLVQ